MSAGVSGAPFSRDIGRACEEAHAERSDLARDQIEIRKITDRDAAVREEMSPEGEHQGLLSVAAPASFAAQLGMPLAEFGRRHPSLHVHRPLKSRQALRKATKI